MSCLDVMYHPHQPYQPYSFYQRHFSQKFGHYKMQDALSESPVDYTSPHHSQSAQSSLGHNHHHHHHYHHTPSTTMAPHTVTSATPVVSQSQTVKEEDRTSSTEDEKESPEAEYFSSRCVVFTHYTGDINKVVDEHFTRALNQPSSFTSSGVKKALSAGSPSTWSKNTEGSVPPMCQRNFPPSFWNSNYVHNSNSSNSMGYPTSSTSFSHSLHHDNIFGDTYSSSLHHRSAAAAGAATDHWHHYPFTTSQPTTYSHRSIHDLSYGTSAFNPRYSSLLIQPPVRTGRITGMPGQCEYPKTATDWSATYSATHGSTTAPQSYGIETATTSALDAQDTSKDLYWF